MRKIELLYKNKVHNTQNECVFYGSRLFWGLVIMGFNKVGLHDANTQNILE